MTDPVAPTRLLLQVAAEAAPSPAPGSMPAGAQGRLPGTAVAAQAAALCDGIVRTWLSEQGCPVPATLVGDFLARGDDWRVLRAGGASWVRWRLEPPDAAPVTVSLVDADTRPPGPSQAPMPAWLAVDCGDEPAGAAVSALVARLLDGLGAVDAGGPVRSTATLVSTEAEVLALVTTLTARTRRGPVIVAGVAPLAHALGWRALIQTATADTMGRAAAFRLTARAADALRAAVGAAHSVPTGSLRVFLPGVCPGSDYDARRHPLFGTDRVLRSTALRTMLAHRIEHIARSAPADPRVEARLRAIAGAELAVLGRAEVQLEPAPTPTPTPTPTPPVVGDADATSADARSATDAADPAVAHGSGTPGEPARDTAPAEPSTPAATTRPLPRPPLGPRPAPPRGLAGVVARATHATDAPHRGDPPVDAAPVVPQSPTTTPDLAPHDLPPSVGAGAAARSALTDPNAALAAMVREARRAAALRRDLDQALRLQRDLRDRLQQEMQRTEQLTAQRAEALALRDDFAEGWAEARAEAAAVARAKERLQENLLRLQHQGPVTSTTPPGAMRRAVPESYPELVAAIATLPGLEFSGDPQPTYDLELHDPLGNWIPRIWDACLVLARYAQSAPRGPSRGPRRGIRERLVELGLPGTRFASAESDQVHQRARWREQRTFTVPTHVDPSGRMFMSAHLKLTNTNVAPRLYFADVTSTAGVVLIGYIGRHPDNSTT